MQGNQALQLPKRYQMQDVTLVNQLENELKVLWQQAASATKPQDFQEKRDQALRVYNELKKTKAFIVSLKDLEK